MTRAMTTIAPPSPSTPPYETTLGATVLSAPRFFASARTHLQHEAFDVRADDGRRLEIVNDVTHGIGQNVPVAVGDHVVVKGVYDVNPRFGPLVHWTHHDPQHTHEDGYIEVGGRRYA